MSLKASQMIPVILSGGAGTRLWPLSRSAFPKQFCDLLDESLLEKTLKRVVRLGSPWTLTIADLQALTSQVFRDLKIPESQIIYEPIGRNTAPAIALICRILELQGRAQEVVGIFPSDHLISREDVFLNAIALAAKCAEAGSIVTLGIEPAYPATGFGYIETSIEKANSFEALSAFPVMSFREKPSLVVAIEFIEKKNFYWNAGIFVFKVETMITQMQKHAPEIWNGLHVLKKDLSNLSEVYSSLPQISIDYAVMEKLRDGLVCIPCDLGWNDLGSWDDVSKAAQDSSIKFSNYVQTVEVNSKNNFAFSSGKKVIGLVNVENLVVVDTPDALLVAKKGATQNVRHVVDELSKRGDLSAKEHLLEKRPWGNYRILHQEDYFKSKLITVEPGSQISYQYHNKRDEHWTIVRGEGEVTLDEKVIKVIRGKSIFIAAGTKHRIRNTGSVPLEFVEVQTGTYFGEDDIVRIKDDYNRK